MHKPIKARLAIVNTNESIILFLKNCKSYDKKYRSGKYSKKQQTNGKLFISDSEEGCSVS